MASEIKANKISPATGTAFTIGDSGDTFTLPSGATLAVASGATISNAGTQSGFGLFTSYAIIYDQKTVGTNGGSLVSGAWRTRDLNTIHADPDSIVTLSSNQFTLGAGTYWIEAFTTASYVQRHQLAIYDVTGTTLYAGMNSFSQTTGDMWTPTMVSMRHTAASSNTYELQHRCQSTGGVNSLGVEHGSFWTDAPEIYSIVKIFKEA